MRTQELYAVVFVSRYLDLFFTFISVYNTVMKVFFITSSFCIIWYMRHHRIVSQTYDREQDTFRVAFLVVPCIFLALLVNHEFSMVEVLWTFSIYLESVAILPQLILLQRTFNVDTLTSNYVFLLGVWYDVTMVVAAINHKCKLLIIEYRNKYPLHLHLIANQRVV